MNTKIKLSLIISGVFLLITGVLGVVWILNKQNTDSRSDAAFLTELENNLANFNGPELIIYTDNSIKVNKEIWGVNWEGYVPLIPYDAYRSKDQFISHFGADALKDLGVTSFRFPGGCTADNYDWRTGQIRYFQPEFENKTPEQLASIGLGNSEFINVQNGVVTAQGLTIDQAIEIADYLGAEFIYQFNMSFGGVPEKNYCGQYTRALGSVEDAVEIAKRYKGKIDKFELGNEQYINTDPEIYKQNALQIVKALAQDDVYGWSLIPPVLPIGFSLHEKNRTDLGDRWQKWDNMINELLDTKCYEGSVGAASFSVPCFNGGIATHHYNGGYSDDYEYVYPIWAHSNWDKVFKENNPFLKRPPIVDNSLARGLNITEWNLVCWDDLERDTTFEHGIYVFETLMQFADNGVKSAYYHDFTRMEPNYLSGCWLASDQNQLSYMGQGFSLSSKIAGGKKFGTSIRNNPDYFLTNSGLQLQSGDEGMNINSNTSVLSDALEKDSIEEKQPLGLENALCGGGECLDSGAAYPTIQAHAGQDSKGERSYLYLINNSEQKVSLKVDLNNLTTFDSLETLFCVYSSCVKNLKYESYTKGTDTTNQERFFTKVIKEQYTSGLNTVLELEPRSISFLDLKSNTVQKSNTLSQPNIIPTNQPIPPLPTSEPVPIENKLRIKVGKYNPSTDSNLNYDLATNTFYSEKVELNYVGIQSGVESYFLLTENDNSFSGELEAKLSDTGEIFKWNKLTNGIIYIPPSQLVDLPGGVYTASFRPYMNPNEPHAITQYTEWSNEITIVINR